MREFIIAENDADQRVDKFLQKTLKTLPKSLMYKYIRNKKIKVNRKRCEISQRLQVGDSMQCYIAEEFFEGERKQHFLQVCAKLNIVYEDDNLLIVDKPKGLLVHRDSDEIQDNLADRILHYLYEKKEYNPQQVQSFTPALCHRIDRNTQGMVMAAKNARTLREMNEHIREHEVIKKYLCIVEGHFETDEAKVLLYHRKGKGNKAEISPIYKEGYKEIKSRYRVLEKGKRYTLVEVEIISGKSHQIRAMMSYLKHPLLGDVKYGARKDGRISYQELCAYYLKFVFQKEDSLSYLNQREFELKALEIKQLFQKVNKET